MGRRSGEQIRADREKALAEIAAAGVSGKAAILHLHEKGFGKSTIAMAVEKSVQFVASVLTPPEPSANLNLSAAQAEIENFNLEHDLTMKRACETLWSMKFPVPIIAEAVGRSENFVRKVIFG